MKILGFTFFEKKSSVYDQYENNYVDTFLGLSSASPTDINPRLAYNLNKKNNDLGKATGDIGDAIAAFRKGLKNTNTKEFDFDNGLIKLLNNPRGGMNSNQFWRSLIESFLLTQEIWIVARGPVAREPQELVFVKAYDINITLSQVDGLPTVVQTISTKDRNIYKREEVNGKIRFIDELGFNEIIPIIGAISEKDEWRGRCPLTKLFYDIDMNTEGKRHNVSLIKNGMKTSGVISPKTGTGQEKPKFSTTIMETLSKRLRSFNQGAGNAGNVLIVGQPADFTAFGQSNTDMDYINLLKNSQEAIYNLYKIPLPRVLSDAMTLDNYRASLEQFYTEAVYPVYKMVASGIMDGLRERFGVGEEWELSFSEADIEAMATVLVERMERLKKTGVVKTNEIRHVGGLEEVEGGEEILVPANLVPLSTIAGPEFGEVDDPDLDDPGEVDDDE